jgi:hypothetical protein
MYTRPILNAFARTPWVAKEPIDRQSVAEIMPRQVQVAFRADAQGMTRPVALTPAAHELLHGPHRAAARRFFAGVIDAAHAVGAGTALRGMSLSDSDAGFATNALASMMESGYLPNSIASHDRTRFLRDFHGVAAATRGARAQNTGWMDIGPNVSAHIVSLIRNGASRTSRDAITETGLVVTHELQHSVTPPGPKVADRHIWLEEGSAETLTWWPGATRATLRAIGAPQPDDPSPLTVPGTMLPSPAYQAHHKRIMALLDMAGVRPFDDDGHPVAGSLDHARTLLQSSHVSGVPRDLARAIARHQGIDSRHVPEIAARIELLGERGGDAKSVIALHDDSR